MGTKQNQPSQNLTPGPGKKPNESVEHSPRLLSSVPEAATYTEHSKKQEGESSGTGKSQIWLIEFWPLCSSLVLGLCLIIVSHHLPKSYAPNLSAEPMREAGSALIASFVIGVTIEHLSRSRSEREHQERLNAIQQNIFAYLFGFQVNHSLMAEAEKLVRKTTFSRRDARIRFRFQKCDENRYKDHTDDPLLLIDVVISYYLKNNGSGPQKHPLKAFAYHTLPFGREDCQFRYLSVSNTSIGNIYKSPEREKIVKADGPSRFMELPNGIEVLPTQEAYVEYAYSLLKRKSDSELWSTNIPIQGVTAIVECEPGIEDLEFQLEALNSAKVERNPKDWATHRDMPCVWAIPNWFLPYQGIILVWFPTSVLNNTDSIAQDMDASRENAGPVVANEPNVLERICRHNTDSNTNAATCDFSEPVSGGEPLPPATNSGPDTTEVKGSAT